MTDFNTKSQQPTLNQKCTRTTLITFFPPHYQPLFELHPNSHIHHSKALPTAHNTQPNKAYQPWMCGPLNCVVGIL